jgi:hypothetical protein
MTISLQETYFHLINKDQALHAFDKDIEVYELFGEYKSHEGRYLYSEALVEARDEIEMADSNTQFGIEIKAFEDKEKAVKKYLKEVIHERIKHIQKLRDTEKDSSEDQATIDYLLDEIKNDLEYILGL